ncbi:4428_t:CDS:2 [Paraglomus brasilianum]|uniref:4428_t:CDS:1 n=1 Tax=Paraglomus brasilianum TaxID=144538 RepID=A0A9N9GZP4_9GLOM|nr:4428_t:CDS:2 [Paraglomus brasilianum]
MARYDREQLVIIGKIADHSSVTPSTAGTVYKPSKDDINITKDDICEPSKQFVGKDANGLKWFETNIFDLIIRTYQDLRAKLIGKRKVEVNNHRRIGDQRKYCEIHHFDFVSQIGAKTESYKKTKQTKPVEDQPIIPSLSHIEPPSPATLASDSSSSTPITTIQ